ncbi:hypothetical protein WDZ92_11620 [Nostoc sp. NIES-2111]
MISQYRILWLQLRCLGILFTLDPACGQTLDYAGEMRLLGQLESLIKSHDNPQGYGVLGCRAGSVNSDIEAIRKIINDPLAHRERFKSEVARLLASAENAPTSIRLIPLVSVHVALEGNQAAATLRNLLMNKSFARDWPEIERALAMSRGLSAVVSKSSAVGHASICWPWHPVTGLKQALIGLISSNGSNVASLFYSDKTQSGRAESNEVGPRLLAPKSAIATDSRVGFVLIGNYGEEYAENLLKAPGSEREPMFKRFVARIRFLREDGKLCGDLQMVFGHVSSSRPAFLPHVQHVDNLDEIVTQCSASSLSPMLQR